MNDNKSDVRQMHTHLLKTRKLQAGILMALQQGQANLFGQVYKHWKGNTYFPLCAAMDTVTGTAVIVYMNEQGQVFSRPQEEFFGFADEEQTVKRFTLMQD